MCGALKKIAEQNKHWAEQHPGILLGTWAQTDAEEKADAGAKLQPVERQTTFEYRQLSHLKDCLCPHDAQPRLEAVRPSRLPKTLANMNIHTLFQVLLNAAKKLGVHFHFNELLPGVIQSSDPHVLLSFEGSEFSWTLLDKKSEESEKHEDLRNRFKQLFERLLPYSNKEVSYRACPICIFLRSKVI